MILSKLLNLSELLYIGKIWKLSQSKSFQAKYLVPSATLHEGFTFLHSGFYSEAAPDQVGIVLKHRR